MKFLTDTEILNWNRKMDNPEYIVYPLPNNRGADPDISYRKVTKTAYSETFIIVQEPVIKYQFTFSITSNRVDQFFEIFEKLIKEPFGTKSVFTKGDNSERKLTDIHFDEKIVESKEKNLHKIKEKEYLRLTYKFHGRLGSIMAYVSYLEDAIQFFSLIWGYTENGEEIQLLKYPIGAMVSPVGDKSKDFLVLDYKFTKEIGGSKYYVDYIASEILNTGTIIKYGNPVVYCENEICFSRSSRIDDILN